LEFPAYENEEEEDEKHSDDEIYLVPGEFAQLHWVANFCYKNSFSTEGPHFFFAPARRHLFIRVFRI
jgi:hypothetical protein